MANVALKNKTDDGKARMQPDLIHAAQVGDIEEAILALKENPDCIQDTNHLGMNALQVSMVNFHTHFGLFLISDYEINMLDQDFLGRDSLDIAFLCSNSRLGDEIYKKWNIDIKKHSKNVIPVPSISPR